MTTDNIDLNEIHKFEQLAHQWWDTSGDMKPLHDINPLRLSFIQSHTDLSGQNILDVGCGGGILSEALATAGGEVTGIDMCEALIQVATLHAAESNLPINYQHISTTTFLKNAPESFNILSCMELLEHVEDPARLIEECAQLLKPGGQLFVSTINRKLKSYLHAIIGAEYLLKLLPRGTHNYQRFIKPSELEAWCQSAGLSLVAAKGMRYNPLSKQYCLTDSLDVNYLFYLEKKL